MKWVLSTIITIILVPKFQPLVSEYIQSEFINSIGLGVAIFIFTLFITILIVKQLSREVNWKGFGTINKGFGFFQSKPSTSFSPVAVTIDELGKSWVDGKLHETIMVDLNNIPLGRNQTGEDMTFNFYELITHAAKTRNLSSGSIFGSGTISNMSSNGGPEDTIGQGGRGYSCIVEKRTVETIKLGRPISPYMLFQMHLKHQL